MNIAVAKMGRTIKFQRNLWHDGAGNNEPTIFIEALAKRNPDNNYYIVGRSDFSKIRGQVKEEMFPNHNVFDGFEGYDKPQHDAEMYPTELLKDVDFDYGIVIGGISGRVNVSNRYKRTDRVTGLAIQEDRFVLPSNMFHTYAAPVINFFNIKNIPWVFFTSDARQVPINTHDMKNRAVKALGTMDKKYYPKFFSGEGYNGQDITTIEREMSYAAGELVTALDESVSAYNGETKDIKLGLYFHKYHDEARANAIKSYIDGIDGVQVFGNWKEELEEGDPRFKGSLSFDEVQDSMKHTKYTLCYPITDGDVSAKWFEAIRAGVIPLFAAGYDSQRHLQEMFSLPDFMYLKEPADLARVIEALEEDEDAYKFAQDHLQKVRKQIEENILDFYQDEINKALEEAKNQTSN